MVGDFTLPEVVMDVLGEGDWVDEAPDPFHQPVMQSTYHFVSLCRYDPLCVIQFIDLMPRALFSFAGFSREAETRGPFDGAILHGSPGISDDSDAQRVVVQHGMAQCCHLWPSIISLYICLYSPGPISSLKMSQAQEHTGTVKKHPRQIKGAAVFVAQLWKSRGFSSIKFQSCRCHPTPGNTRGGATRPQRKPKAMQMLRPRPVRPRPVSR